PTVGVEPGRPGPSPQRATIPPMPRTARSAALALAVVATAAAPGAGATVWSAPHPLSNCGAPPDLTLSRDGVAGVVFANADDCGGDSAQGAVLSESRPPGGDWSAPTPLPRTVAADTGPAPYGSPAYDDAAGARIVAWFAGGAIHAAVRDPTGAWGPDTTLARGRALRSGLALAIGDSGDAAVAWVRSDSVVEAAVRAPGGRWSAPARIIGGPGPAGSPSVSVDATGRGRGRLAAQARRARPAEHGARGRARSRRGALEHARHAGAGIRRVRRPQRRRRRGHRRGGLVGRRARPR